MNTSDLLFLLTLLVGSFLGSYLLFPKVIAISNTKSLMAQPNSRSSHTNKTPNMGGLVFFIAFIFAVYFAQKWDPTQIGLAMVPGLMVLFIIGLKDDLMTVSPLTKIVAQCIAISFTLLHPAFHIEALHGFMGIEQVPVVLMLPLSAFLMLSIINAFNLIDGIDGLASIVGIVIFSVLGFLFYLLEHYYFTVLSVVIIGSLVAFLFFNLSTKKKIFMGDTGSMLIGFVMACAVIRIFSIPRMYLKELPFMMENVHLVILALLVVPFFDMTRVFSIRALNKKSPFSADRNHIHHIFIDYFHLSHRRTSIFIGCINVCFIALFIVLGANMDSFALFILFLFLIFLFSVFFYRVVFLHKK